MQMKSRFLAIAGNCGNRSSFGRPKLRAATSRQHCRTESPAIESRRIDAVWTERNLPARSQPPGECRALCFPNRPSQILPLKTFISKEPRNVLHFLHFYTVLENLTVFRLNHRGRFQAWFAKYCRNWSLPIFWPPKRILCR